jgi:hypothetical protein
MGSGWRLIAKDFAWVAFVFSPLSVRFGPSRFWESHHALPQLQPYEIALNAAHSRRFQEFLGLDGHRRTRAVNWETDVSRFRTMLWWETRFGF